MARYEYLSDDELTPERLMEDQEFLQDAGNFLYERTSQELYEPEAIYENFMEHMRAGSVNEITLVKDLDYAQDADEEGKQRFGRLIDTFDRMPSDFSMSMVGDYGEGILTAPSTYAAIPTGGAAKVGTQATIQAGRLALKEKLKGAARGAARVGAFEAAVAGGQEELIQQTREEVGLERQEGAVGYAAAGGALFGALPGGFLGYKGTKEADAANRLIKESQMAVEKKKTAQKIILKEEKEKLNKLDPELVRQGDELLDSLNKNEYLKAKLNDETLESVATAVADIASTIERKPGQRITEAVADAIIEGKISGEQINKVKAKYKISDSEFATAYLSSVSDAAKTLQRQGQIKKMIRELSQKAVGGEYDEIEDIADAAEPNKILEFLRNADKLRLGMMTSQVVTTMRNTAGGGIRTIVDVLDKGFLAMINKMQGKKTNLSDIYALPKQLLFNQKEAKAIQTVFEQEMPAEARRIFFSAADAEVRTGSKSKMGYIGRKLNALNTFSDNVFKRAVFSTTLDQAVRERMGKSLVEIIQDGEFNAIDKKLIKHAIDESLSFTYQKTPDSKLGRDILSFHRDAPFVLSTTIPFPRFLMNQLEFVKDHYPGAALAWNRAAGKKITSETLAKQMTGMTLLSGFTAYTALYKDSDLRWDEYRDERGKIGQLGPMAAGLAPMMITGDLMGRYIKGERISSIADYAVEIAQALGTPRPTGTSAFQIPDYLEDFSRDLHEGKTQRALGKMFGNVLSTYTLPFATVKDVYAQFDPDARHTKNVNQWIDPSKNDSYVGDIFEYAMIYGLRYAPTGAIPEEDRKASPTAGEMRPATPLLKQATGIAKYQEKNTFVSELDRLQVDKYDIYKPSKDPVRDLIEQDLLKYSLPKYMESYIMSSDYQNIPTNNEKAVALTRKARDFIAEERKVINPLMQAMVVDGPEIKGGGNFRYSHLHRAKYEALNTDIKKAMEARWERSGMKDKTGGMSITQSGGYAWAYDMGKKLGYF